MNSKYCDCSNFVQILPMVLLTLYMWPINFTIFFIIIAVGGSFLVEQLFAYPGTPMMDQYD